MADRRSGMVQSFGYPYPQQQQQQQQHAHGSNSSSRSSSIVSRAVAAAAANNHHSNRTRSSSGRGSKRYSVSVFYSMAAEQDVEVQDDLAQAQKRLRELKNKISTQSKKNFMRERDVRFLDARIGLLIQNRMALEEQHEVASRLEDHHPADSADQDHPRHHRPHYLDDERRLQQYGNLFYLLQSEPRHMAILCRLVNLSEIDNLLQTVMFTLYGNQYESREEHLLLTMFQNVLAAQFETTAEFTSLLRANTPVSRMMTTYTRRGPGQSYLKSVLSEKINQLILDQKDLNLQINPLKVYEELLNDASLLAQYSDGNESIADFPKSVTAEVAANNPILQKIIQPRLAKLMEIADAFLSTLTQSLEQVPYGIRWICKQIRSLAKRKYPHTTDHAISSLIGGFFFLRFVNPAIVTPQAYMLVESAPHSHSRTTLTLLAKMLQNLANKPSYAKEAYMIPTNRFVEQNKQRTIQFLNDLCEVGDFYEQLEMDQYMALSKKDIMISITPNEIYNTISLLHQHLDILAPKETDHLRVLVKEVVSAPGALQQLQQPVPRKENKPFDLPLFSRWEMPIQDLTLSLMSENNITQNDILYMEAKSTFVQIIRTLPHLAQELSGATNTQKQHHPGNPIPTLHRIAETAGTTTNDAQLVHKGIKVKEMVRELEEAGVIDPRDNHQFLIKEIKQELTHLGDLSVKVMEELTSLESVYQTILDHNQYLQSQLESYKAYLQNVRIQTTLHGSSSSHQNKKKKWHGSSDTGDYSHDDNTVGLGVKVVVPEDSSTTTKKGNHSNTLRKSTSSLLAISTSSLSFHQSSPSLSTLSQTQQQQQTSSSTVATTTTTTTTAAAAATAASTTAQVYKYSYYQLEKEGIITETEIPPTRRHHMYLTLCSPMPGTFIIALHYKGRDKPVLEIDLKLDDLLEKQQDHIKTLDLEYAKLNVSKTLQLFNKLFLAKTRTGFFS
ncbi:Rho GTPase activation protein [Mycotypha africana]|uniref:Rho GTPase activation protein n=1 Tax=Mycotypha africana TaxID=64632 RepID=UPI0022FFDA4B|nr:Rho GTPase activation protein [Mycotypha africana]KAI8967074.1 Rho GTPase activation protein [Mycotypha africana]